MSAKYKYIFFLFVECKSEPVHHSAWDRAREPKQQNPRAHGFAFNSTSFYKQQTDSCKTS